MDVDSAPISALSHGYKQRVGLAQALVHNPSLLILDEPTSGLDPLQIIEMRELIRNLQGQHTLLISSHFLVEISQTCDRLLVIDQGRIVFQGSEAALAEVGGVNQRFRVEVEGSDAGQKAKAAIESVEGVSEITYQPPSTGGEQGSLVLAVEAERDVRPSIVRALVAAEVGVLGVSPLASNLESTFAQLIHKPEETAP